jgi:hypothetical protein
LHNNYLVIALLSSSSPALPSTLAEIRAIAEPMFSDSAVASVNVLASFGEVEVKRDGTIWMKEGK